MPLAVRRAIAYHPNIEVVTYSQPLINAAWTNMPLAETRWAANGSSFGPYINLSLYTQMRFTFATTNVGTAAAVLRMKYSVPPYAVETNIGPDMSIAALGVTVTPWFTIPVDARVDFARTALWGAGGNGTADPAIRGFYIHLR